MVLRPDVPSERRQTIHAYANWIAFAQSEGDFSWKNGKMRLTKAFIEEQKAEDDDDDEDGSCPTKPESIPMCDDCGGNAASLDRDESIGKCKGVRTTTASLSLSPLLKLGADLSIPDDGSGRYIRGVSGGRTSPRQKDSS